MSKKEHSNQTHRRGFLAMIASGAAALGISMVGRPASLMAEKRQPVYGDHPAEEWFNRIKGKHRIVFDATGPHEMFPFAWPKVFLLTNSATGTPEKDNSVVVILRHSAIPYAFQSALWAKYKFGEVFKVDDPTTKAPSLRNPFWQPRPGDFKIPGVGSVDIGIDQLQQSGVMFCVCDMAITVYSAVMAQNTGQEASAVKKEFIENVLPGIQVVPSGVWAVGRAQEHQCAYCFVG